MKFAGETQAIAPDYYPEFTCKCGDCRHTCCSGWGISINMKEYFRLIGMDCSPELRHRLDGAFSVVENPTELRYASLNPDWRGTCPLQQEDGRCALQLECGEFALPTICRTYPRGMRSAFGKECSCSNSCERVLELLFDRKEPLKLIPIESTEGLTVTEAPEGEQYARRDREIRNCCIRFLQDRRTSLPVRLLRLGHALKTAESLRNECQQSEVRSAVEAELENVTLYASGEEDLRFAFHIQYELMEILGKGTRSLGDVVSEVFKRYRIMDGELPTEDKIRLSLERYREASRSFDRQCPDWEVLCEHMLVNHVIFDGFPYSARHETLWDEYLALTAVYSVLRFTVVGWMEEHSGREALIDVCAAVFRLVEHSSFTWNAPIVLRMFGADRFDSVEKYLIG